MIGQGISFRFLVPLALEVLEREPLVEADHYPGDLLASVLRIEGGTWSRHPARLCRVHSVLDGLPEVPEELTRDVAAFQRATPAPGDAGPSRGGA